MADWGGAAAGRIEEMGNLDSREGVQGLTVVTKLCVVTSANTTDSPVVR